MTKTKPIRVEETKHTAFFLWCIKNSTSMTQQIGRLIDEFLLKVEKGN